MVTSPTTPPYTLAELADLIRSNGGIIRTFVDTGIQPEWAPPELADDIEALNAVIEQLGPYFERIAEACGYDFDIEDRGGLEEILAERENALAAERDEDVQAVAEACAGVVDGTPSQPYRHEYAVRRLRKRFADRIAELQQRDPWRFDASFPGPDETTDVED